MCAFVCAVCMCVCVYVCMCVLCVYVICVYMCVLYVCCVCCVCMCVCVMCMCETKSGKYMNRILSLQAMLNALNNSVNLFVYLKSSSSFRDHLPKVIWTKK